MTSQADTDKMLTETSCMESKRRTKPNTDGKPPTRFNPNAVRLRSKQEDSIVFTFSTKHHSNLSSNLDHKRTGRGKHKSTHKSKKNVTPAKNTRTDKRSMRERRMW